MCLVASVSALVAKAAQGAPSVAFQAKLHPERLGASTTISIAFHIAANGQGESAANGQGESAANGQGESAVPLSGFDIRLPGGMGLAASTLGLATCSRETLLSDGAGACPSESAMGMGSAEVQAAFGEEPVTETAPVSIFMTTPVEGATTMLFYFDGRQPLIAPVVLQTRIVTESLDSVLSTTVPTIATSSDGPPATVIALKASIGPDRLRYFKHVHGRTVAYRPIGLNTPERCPAGGFRFGADFQFADGSHASAQSAVPCPSGGPRHRAPGGRRK